MSFNLGDIESKARAGAAPVVKKPRLAETTKRKAPDIFQTFAHTLHDIRKQIRDQKLRPETVELEFRVGMLVVGDEQRWESSWEGGGCLPLQQAQAQKDRIQFVSGIDEAVVDKLKHLLSSKGYTSTYKEERVRMGTTGSKRCIVDEEGNEKVTETKQKVLRLDFGCVGHQYDGRLEVATEVAHASSGSSEHSQKWTVERLKQRTSYEKSHCVWRVDLTHVTSTQLDIRKKETNVELEFELSSDTLQQWLNCSDDNDENESRRFSSWLATELREVLNTCISQTCEEGSTGTMNNPITSIPHNNSICTEVLRLNNSIIGSASTSYSPDDFLGSMPLNISRRNIILLERESYFVTEKSDGVRYLMYVISPKPNSNSEIAIFVDRAGNYFRPPGAELIGSGLKAGTVLDGEIVFNLKHKRHVFLVFDIICNEYKPCAQLSFSARTGIIKDNIMKKCGDINYSSQESPLWIIRKKFWPKKDLKELLAFMTVSSEGNRLFKESERRHHKSDGLIFQPDAPYVFGTDVTLVKWKWPELTSVDLQVLPTTRPDITKEPSLMAGGPDGTLVDCCKRGRSHVGLGKFDTWRLMADIRDSSCRVHIAEVAFRPQVGLWTYFQLRYDKDAPNYINTVMSILMEQAEDINIDELVSRLLADDEISSSGRPVKSSSGV